MEAGKDPDFGRETLVGPMGKPVPIKTAPFYGAVARKGLLITKGGLTTNENSQLLNVFGEVIPNVYAAGEVGWRYQSASTYHTGAYLGSCVVFGRIAGKNAAKEKSWS
ncbi:MAG: FAD-binding protein [Desulfobacterales bacterium]|nr:FAD-binding protein [Desulfobacterales bacterium]